MKLSLRKLHPQEYECWQRMKQRCVNPNRPDYSRYGGRGIQVCARWMKSFANFFTYVGPRPSNEHSIDRYPNNDGNYEPGNVRWANRSQQALNRRNFRTPEWRRKQRNAHLQPFPEGQAKRLYLQGLTITAVAERLHVGYYLVWDRLNRPGVLRSRGEARLGKANNHRNIPDREIAQLRQAGMSLAALGQKYNVSPGTIRLHMLAMEKDSRSQARRTKAA